jgi:hypothetical protein
LDAQVTDREATDSRIIREWEIAIAREKDVAWRKEIAREKDIASSMLTREREIA